MSVEVHTLVGAYVLDALPTDERAHFERHLTECDVCAAEVHELLEVAARLAVSADEPAPPSLRRRVLNAIDIVRPLSPPGQADRPRSWGRRLARVAAAIVALVVVGGLGARLGSRADRGFDAVAGQVLAAPDVRTVVLEGDRGVRATLHWSPDRDEGVLIATGLAPPEGGGVYQSWAWADGEGQPRPAGSFDAPEGGTVSHLIQDLRGVRQVAVTIEPGRGATAPTGPVVLQGALT